MSRCCTIMLHSSCPSQDSSFHAMDPGPSMLRASVPSHHASVLSQQPQRGPIMTQCRPVRPWSRPVVPIAARSQHAAGPQRVSACRPVARGRLFQSSRPHRRRRRLVLDVLPPPSQSSVIVQCRLPAEHVAPSSLHRPSLDSGVTSNSGPTGQISKSSPPSPYLLSPSRTVAAPAQ